MIMRQEVNDQKQAKNKPGRISIGTIQPVALLAILGYISQDNMLGIAGCSPIVLKDEVKSIKSGKGEI